MQAEAWLQDAEAEAGVIAFEETRGMTLEQIFAAIAVAPGSPAAFLADDHIDVTGCRGVIELPGAHIRLEGLERILPWPVQG